MNSLNRVFLFGNLGNRPEVKMSKNGRSYVSMSLATHRRWKNPEGESQERTDWHRVVVWGKRGENCARFLDKGSPVLVEGTIDHWKTEGEDGKPQYETSITAREVTYVPKNSQAGGAGSD